MGAHPSSRAAAALAATALLVCVSLTPADAASTAEATSARVTASSGTWGAVATTNTAAPYTGALVLSFPGTTTKGNTSFPPQFFSVVNTGTLDITAATYTATGTPATATFTIEACTGGWSQTNNCPSGQTTVLTTATSPQPSAVVPVQAGKSIRLRASVTGTVAKSTVPSLTVELSVTRAQIRAAITTGS